MKYTKEQIHNAISHWQKVIESYDNKVDKEYDGTKFNNFEGSNLRNLKITTFKRFLKFIESKVKYGNNTRVFGVSGAIFCFNKKTNTLSIETNLSYGKFEHNPNIKKYTPNWDKITKLKNLKDALNVICKKHNIQNPNFRCDDDIVIVLSDPSRIDLDIILHPNF